MKKRTLNQTWTLCLRMWRWIAKEWPTTLKSISTLKSRWLSKNGFGGENIDHNCFFCDYNGNRIECRSCPGKLVNRRFGCANDAYYYLKKPGAFYKELLRLNRIRKAKK